MFLCSICSIVAGGSLGPEAPIVALSAGVVSFISRSILNHRGRMLRYCTLMGMGAALAAFFGVAIGGACIYCRGWVGTQFSTSNSQLAARA